MKELNGLKPLKNYATSHVKLFFLFSQNWFQVTLDQWVQRHKKRVATDGNYVEKVSRTLDIDV